jgi:hypothetical protein
MTASQTPKMMREALCAAQSCVNGAYRAELQVLIDQIDRIRPLGSDGKHNDRHTRNCGCEGHVGVWSLNLYPEVK